MSRPLVVIPTYVRTADDNQLVANTVASIHRTAGDDVDILIVDDGSPEPSELGKIDALIHYKTENTGFSSTVNVGLRRALEQGRDAVLVNADIEFITPGWAKVMQEQRGLISNAPAGVVGALLLYPNGLIQHAGVYFSLLTRTFDHLYKFGPANLPEALVPQVLPVTGALQFIRHETLMTVGLYDESFRMGWEDVDYCVRTMLTGRECVYQPKVRAWHMESVFRGRPSDKVRQWQIESFLRLMEKYADQSFAGLVPTL